MIVSRPCYIHNQVSSNWNGGFYIESGKSYFHLFAFVKIIIDGMLQMLQRFINCNLRYHFLIFCPSQFRFNNLRWIKIDIGYLTNQPWLFTKGLQDANWINAIDFNHIYVDFKRKTRMLSTFTNWVAIHPLLGLWFNKNTEVLMYVSDEFYWNLPGDPNLIHLPLA